jgi:hypothetical protein
MSKKRFVRVNDNGIPKQNNFKTFTSLMAILFFFTDIRAALAFE